MILKEEKEKWKKEQDRDRRRKTNGKEGRIERKEERKRGKRNCPQVPFSYNACYYQRMKLLEGI